MGTPVAAEPGPATIKSRHPHAYKALHYTYLDAAVAQAHQRYQPRGHDEGQGCSTQRRS